MSDKDVSTYHYTITFARKRLRWRWSLNFTHIDLPKFAGLAWSYKKARKGSVALAEYALRTWANR